MKKENRLLKNQEFKLVLDSHKCVSRENFKIFSRKNEIGNCRVGVSVSSKIGNSIVRHRVKRQIMAMLDSCLNKDASYDFVIIVKNVFLEKTYQENFSILSNVINYILKKGKQENE